MGRGQVDLAQAILRSRFLGSRTLQVRQKCGEKKGALAPEVQANLAAVRCFSPRRELVLLPGFHCHRRKNQLTSVGAFCSLDVGRTSVPALQASARCSLTTEYREKSVRLPSHKWAPLRKWPEPWPVLTPFYSTMTPSRNLYISMKTSGRCQFYSTMKPGGAGC
jgi:hypothetical protein